MGIVVVVALPANAGATPPVAANTATSRRIDRAGRITVNIIRAEMGQHVGTALAHIVADELARLVYCQPAFFINSARAFDCSRGYHRLWLRDCTG